MAAFRDESEFAEELALRTLLNYYKFKSLDNHCTPEEKKDAQFRYNGVKAEMHKKEFMDVDVCSGTQMLNSLIGLLILPQQQYFENIKTVTQWRNQLPTLAYYVFIYPEFYDIDKVRFGDGYKPTLGRILRKMRNSISHDRVHLLPVSSNGDQVTDIVFEDAHDKNSEIDFRLVVEKKDLEKLLVEISEYFIDKQWQKNEKKGKPRYRR